MTGVTADTNIYVSGLHFGGLPMQFLDKALAGAFRLAVSVPLMAEVRRVLREKFAWSDDEITGALSQFEDCTMLVHPGRTLAVIEDDPDDNRILECAVTAGSDYIVTGDNHLLRLGRYGGIQIVKVANFLPLLPAL